MKFGDLRLDEIIALITQLNGRKGVDGLLNGRALEPAKYGQITLGQIEAFIGLVGGLEVFEAVLRREKGFNVTDEAIKLFDRNGRRIPPRALGANVVDPEPAFFWTQPEINYDERLIRIANAFAFQGLISAQEFKSRAETILDDLRADKSTQAITRGVYLPFFLPKVKLGGDYGAALDEVFLPAIKRSYQSEFPRKSFHDCNCRRNVAFVDGSRHEQLWEAMGKGDVVGVYFPAALSGYSVNAARKQMASLPGKFLLAGGCDVAGALVAYPDVLAKDGARPTLGLAAMQWQSRQASLCVAPSTTQLNFFSRESLNFADSGRACGLVVIG